MNPASTLQSSEDCFRLLLADNPLPMWVYDQASFRFLEVNEAAIDHYRHSREEFLAMSMTDIHPPEEVPRWRDYIASRAARGTSVLAPSGRWRHRLKGGRVIEVEIFSHALDLGGASAMLVVAQDITERKQVEAQLLQAQKMEGIGRLAGGIAHDFNNLMTVIMSRSELLHHRLPAEPRALRDVEVINKTARRAAELTRQLLVFSRKQVLQPTVIDLNGVVTEMAEMLRRLINEDIEFSTVLAADAPRVKADRAQLEQVILNLAVNARDAMPGGGVLTLQASSVKLDESFVRHHPGSRPGPHGMLEVRDSGHGMDAETLSHIFEPFFTTKGPDKGTGLGLATVYGIVKQHDGYIWVESEPGWGTTFKIYLPQVTNPAEAEAAVVAQPTVSAGSETVLLVEDEADVRTVAREILTENGYSVLEAANVSEAVELTGDHVGPIHLLVTDVVLPHMGGSQLASVLEQMRTGMKVVYVSGHADEALGRHGVLDGGVFFLPKPFTPSTLLRKVREALDAPRGTSTALTGDAGVDTHDRAARPADGEPGRALTAR